MTRRSGQSPTPKIHRGYWTILYRTDVPGQEARVQKRERICPASGPGSLTASEIARKAKEIIQRSGADTVEHFEKCEAINNGESFQQQAAFWLNHSRTRKRRPVKPATAAAYHCYLRKWLNPLLGDLPLACVDNKQLKELVAKLREANLADKSIVEIVHAAELVVASAIGDDGKKRFPREWNYEYIDLPIVDASKQKRPTLTPEELSTVLLNAKGRYQALYCLLAGSGLRIGEALAIHTGYQGDDHTWISSDCKTITVRKSIWQGKEQEPKSPAAKRSVDLCDELAAYLKSYIGDREPGLLFTTANDLPIFQSSIRRDRLKLGVDGCHAFRRFRTSQLVISECPEDLKKFWIGHATKDVTARYAEQSTKIVWRRQEFAEKVGLGFKLPVASHCIPELVANAA